MVQRQVRSAARVGYWDLGKTKDGKISSVRVYCTLNAYNPKVFGGTEATDGADPTLDSYGANSGFHSTGTRRCWTPAAPCPMCGPWP